MCIESVQHKVCPICFEKKSIGYFLYYVGKTRQESKICSKCFGGLRRLDAYYAKILDGVYIPHYETPVKKYKIKSLVLASTE
jgi:hypothetical protein